MSKKFLVSGTAEFTWSKVITVDDEDDPDDYDPPLYLDDVYGCHMRGENVEIESVSLVKAKKEA